MRNIILHSNLLILYKNARRSGKPRYDYREQPNKQHAKKRVEIFYGEGTFSLEEVGAGENIVPRVQLQTKPQHIESAMPVNGATRAMQGSDYMRLQARDGNTPNAVQNSSYAKSFI